MLKKKNLVLRKLDIISTEKAYPPLSLRSMHAYAGHRSNQWLKLCCVKKTKILRLLDFMDVANVHFSGDLFITSYNEGKRFPSLRSYKYSFRKIESSEL